MATVLSVKEPWAELIASQRKTIELRTWFTSYRGELYIHASRNTDIEAAKKVNLDSDSLITGAIICKCTITGVKRYLTREELLKDKDKHFAPDYKIPCYGYTISNVVRIKPFYCPGSLKLFKVTIP